ncbi:MAG: thymidine kinase [Phycisphaerae bacterium]|nr:MAG: thymidine kinase [Phycisphaerae bacterium]
MSAAPHMPSPTNSQRQGIIELICGCMFSGKTTAVLKELEKEPAQNILVLKHNKDDRYSRARIMTHDGEGLDALSVTCSKEIVERVSNETEVVVIDEGHFYDDGLPSVCKQLAEQGKRVIIAALDLDMWGLQFDVIEQIRESAGVVRVQQSICAACGKPATHTHRKTPIVGAHIVGGAEDFEPRCKACWSPPREAHIDSSEMA